MKNLFLLTLLLFAKLGFAQELPYKNGEIVYELSIANGRFSKNEMFESTLSFLKNTFNKKNVFIQSEDLSSGSILAVGITDFKNKSKNRIKYDLGLVRRLKFKIDFKIDSSSSSISIHNIDIIKAGNYGEVIAKLTEDAAQGKMVIENLKDGKLKIKEENLYKKKVDEVNEIFYTILALYKRSIERQQIEGN